ncbi:carbon storage regulator CsrA [Clostridium sp. UBA4548]|uniref:carbon storage regulator CsrA n=1 Tax=Clostridium sp. UBA4548 TaxID=1946361 RepID=UPI0025B89464|nr:carbon storage regulator CsrA [Clostridium sp. UBA4548]
MLVVSRKKGESILVGDDIEITVVKAENGTVRLAIEAPKSVSILRKELRDEITLENKNAVLVDNSILRGLKK